MDNNPRVIIIAGPNGAGKTTFARKFLPNKGTTALLDQDEF
ncbi:zeta toxin family protein [Quatrionicoccus australiensis]|nr:zeta toxin family protein [Quatrionicoccus australiensis]